MPNPTDFNALAEAAFRQAAFKVVRVAQQTGTSIVIWEDGGIRHISADEGLKRLLASGPPASQKEETIKY